MPGRNQIDDLDTLLTLLRTHGVSQFTGDVYGSTYQISLGPVSTVDDPTVELKPDPNPLTGLTSEAEEDLFGA